MTKRLLAVTLTVLLADASFGQAQSSRDGSPREQVRALDIGSPLEVRFLDGSKLRGWISEVSETGFVLSHEKNKRLEKSAVTFSQIQSVKQIKSVKPSHTVRNILIGVSIAVVAIGVAVGIEIGIYGLG